MPDFPGLLFNYARFYAGFRYIKTYQVLPVGYICDNKALKLSSFSNHMEYILRNHFCNGLMHLIMCKC